MSSVSIDCHIYRVDGELGKLAADNTDWNPHFMKSPSLQSYRHVRSAI